MTVKLSNGNAIKNLSGRSVLQVALTKAIGNDRSGDTDAQQAGANLTLVGDRSKSRRHRHMLIGQTQTNIHGIFSLLPTKNTGPAGDPGMRLLQRFLWLSAAKGMSDKIAFLTDGRFSGTNMGCAVAHISPESAVGGPLALVEDGDPISIDVANDRLDLLVDDVEMERRWQAWEAPEPSIKKGYLSVYSRMADKTSRGASLKYG